MRRRKSSPIVRFLSRQRTRLPTLLILTHDHPDPDAMASAWALAYLAHHLCGTRSRMVYGGIIGRMENRLLVRRLRVPIRPLKPHELADASHVALIDTQPPFQNNPFSPNRRATIVIDHHARHPKTKADFALIVETAGASATLLTEAILAAKLDLPARLATAQVYGITSETQNLVRETGPRDLIAYRTLLPYASMRSLSQIQNPPRPDSFFYTLGKAIHRAFFLNGVIGVHLGSVPSQDVIAYMADFLLTHEKSKWALATGRYAGHLYVSLRTRKRRVRADRVLQHVLRSGTSAGGHRLIAGGSVTVGVRASETAWVSAERQLTAAFLRSQGHKPPFRLKFPYRDVHTDG